MKIFLATAMVFGVVFMLETSQPANAIVNQSPISSIEQSQITPARMHFHGGWGPNYYYAPVYDPFYSPFYGVPVYTEPGISLHFRF